MFHVNLKSNLKLILIAALSCAVLWGCDFLFWSNSTPFISKPAQLNPDSDAFASSSLRSYIYSEGWKAGSKDTTVLPRTFRAQKTGTSVHFSATDGYALPASVVTHLGFNPSTLSYDTTNIPEPGPALGFPTIPQFGWRVELTNGDLHFVRAYIGLDTLNQSGSNVECWAFAETTYWNGAAVAMGKYSMGRNGLVDLYEQRPGFNSGNDTTTVLLWREVKAQ